MYVELIFLSPVKLQIYKLVEALYRMSGQVDDKVAEEKIADCVKVYPNSLIYLHLHCMIIQDIIDIVDVDGDGIITKEEFITHAMESQFIANIKMD